MVILASCNHDEEGRLGWEGKSKPGDQTGSEVSLVPYETWDPKVWKAVYRAEDPMVAWRIAQAGIQMCRNNCIGYDQSHRMTFHDELMKTGNIDKINVPCSTDCSAGTCADIIVAGYHDFPNNLRTAYWDKYCMAYGKFRKFDTEEYTRHPDLLEDGDLLLKEGHIVIVASTGKGQKYNTIPKYVLKCTNRSYVYRSPEAKITNIYVGHPLLGKDNLVDYCDEDGDFYFVRIIDKWAWVPKKNFTRRDPVVAYKVGDLVRFKGGKLHVSTGESSAWITVPPFKGEIKTIVNGKAYPYYVHAYAYDGWVSKEEIEKV